MSLKIIYNEEQKIIETIFSGITVFDDVIRMFYEVRELALEKNCYLWLHDFTNADRKMTTVDVYELPKRFAEIMKEKNVSTYKIKRALVGMKDLPDFKFASNVSYNLGLNLEAFDSRELAIGWLKSATD